VGCASCRRNGCAGSACRVRLVIMTTCKACPTTAASVASISWRALAMRPHPCRWLRRGGTRGPLAIPVQGDRIGWARHPPTIRHSARSCARADDGTHAHNTLSADHVRVLYPFHPLHGASLQILRRPKREDGAVCVMDPAGRRLKIPVWMLLPECAEVKIWQQPHLGKNALLSLASLITSQLDFKDRVHDNLLQTRVCGCEEGRRDATSTAGPD